MMGFLIDDNRKRMKFAEDHNEANYKITGYEASGIKINNRLFTDALILSPMTLISDWQATTISSLNADKLDQVYELNPEIILLGTGKIQQFPNPDVLKRLAEMQIGFEIMDTQAACRTFDIIMAEGRNVVAGLFI